MAITETHYLLLRELRQSGRMPACPSILNIGQPNWYGDMNPRRIAEDFPEYKGRIDECLAKPFTHGLLVDVACLAYTALFNATEFVSIDLHGDAQAIKFNLNESVNMLNVGYAPWAMRPYDLVANQGTAEHVFNVAQVFETMHEYCKPGGYMLHEGPLTGWFDHGFYNFQPTLFFDVAAANRYEIICMAVQDGRTKSHREFTTRTHFHRAAQFGSLPANGLWLVVLQRTDDAPFRVPMQAIYGGHVTAEMVRDWMELR